MEGRNNLSRPGMGCSRPGMGCVGSGLGLRWSGLRSIRGGNELLQGLIKLCPRAGARSLALMRGLKLAEVAAQNLFEFARVCDGDGLAGDAQQTLIAELGQRA